MGQKFLIDTNIIIELLGNEVPIYVKEFVNQLPPIISAVTYIETLGWHKVSPKQLEPLQAFMDIATILPISQLVIEKTVVIRQQKRIGLGDAIIAATAIVYDLTLLTRNYADFKNITQLNVVNPWDK